jgi:hypothetical protein
MDPMKTAARVLGLVLATVVMFVAGSGAAFADAPVGSAWPEATKSTLDHVILFGGGTAGLFILVVLLGLLTARRNYVPPSPSTELETTSGTGNTPAHH